MCKCIMFFVLLAASFHCIAINFHELNDQLLLLSKIIPAELPLPVAPQKDEFLETLYKKLEGFPESQTREFTDNDEGKKWKKKVSKCIQGIAKHFKVELEVGDLTGRTVYLLLNGAQLGTGVTVKPFGQRISSVDVDTNGLYTAAKEGITALQKLYNDKSWLFGRVDDATKLYKIHVMPFKNDIPLVIYSLVEAVLNNKTFSNSIAQVKYLLDEPEHSQRKHRPLSPTIVIYVGGGKAHAQTALDTLYKVLVDERDKPMKGLDKTPRFNRKVTSLIYWSQGNGDDKEEYDKSIIYDKNIIYADDLVTYNPIITGKYENYELTDPSKNS